MTKAFRHGLIVGKFSPLHRGHELLIRAALEQCEQVTVISYSKPEYAGCSAAEREHWLATLFPIANRLVIDDARLAALRANHALPPVIPDNAADADVHREFIGLLCSGVLNIRVDAVFTSEEYGDGFAASLTNHFRSLNRMTPPVRHVSVDQQRGAIPISASAIRDDVHAHRAWLAPEVYASFVRRVCILGGESSGKTILAERLADKLGTVWVPEFGREAWEARGGTLEFDDLLAIGIKQVALEEAARGKAFRWLICDTSPLTTLLYCHDLFGRADPQLEQLAARHYDVTLLCAGDFPFVQDGTRRDAAFRDRQQAWYLRELRQRRVGFTTVEGDLENRVAGAIAALEGVRPGPST